jgi:hypothetical protein
MKNNVKNYTPEVNSLGTYRKEQIGLYRQYTVLDLGTPPCAPVDGRASLSQPIIVRLYWPKDTVYACAWICCEHDYSFGKGKGKAGGAGYHKASAAVDAALRSCGIELEMSIAELGDEGIIGALNAIAKHIGLTQWAITEAHA